jgi:hypothetical protein
MPALTPRATPVHADDTALLHVLKAYIETLKAENEILKRRLADAEARAARETAKAEEAIAERLTAQAAKRASAPSLHGGGSSASWRRSLACPIEYVGEAPRPLCSRSEPELAQHKPKAVRQTAVSARIAIGPGARGHSRVEGLEPQHRANNASDKKPLREARQPADLRHKLRLAFPQKLAFARATVDRIAE